MKEKLNKLIKPAILIGLIISSLTILISILIGEYIVRNVLPQHTYKFAREMGMNIFETGENIPLTLQKNVKDYTHIAYTREFTHLVNTNSQRTRGKEILIEKPKNTYRILMLGDSMTFGWGENDDETYSRILETNLK